MRERLTAAFVLLAVILCTGQFIARTVAIGHDIRKHESTEVHATAKAIGIAVGLRLSQGGRVDASYLRQFVAPDLQIAFESTTGGGDVRVRGDDFEGAADPSDSSSAQWASWNVPGGVVVVSHDEDVYNDIVLKNRMSIVLLAIVVVLGAGLGGWITARWLSAPFRKLADAAGALGRGRFDLDLPQTRIPEALAIGTALRTSAGQLQDRISQEQAFAQHTSHVLRTPLTALRLELDHLATGDLPPEVQDSVARCIARIDGLDLVTGDLIRLARGGALVAGAQTPLRDLAGLISQRWADELAQHSRTLTAAIDGDVETTYTPGPVEHILELLLVDVLHRSRGPVQLRYQTRGDGALKITVTATEPATTKGRPREPGAPFVRATAVAMALGGRVEGSGPAPGLMIWLPRR